VVHELADHRCDDDVNGEVSPWRSNGRMLVTKIEPMS
jgi:hypothetical protein